MVITVFLILKYTGVKYGRDEKWKEETIKNTSETQFRTEFECEFLGSIDTLISASKLRVLSHNEYTTKQRFGYLRRSKTRSSLCCYS